MISSNHGSFYPWLPPSNHGLKGFSHHQDSDDSFVTHLHVVSLSFGPKDPKWTKLFWNMFASHVWKMVVSCCFTFDLQQTHVSHIQWKTHIRIMIYTNGSVYLSALVHIPIQDIFIYINLHTCASLYVPMWTCNEPLIHSIWESKHSWQELLKLSPDGK